MAVCIAVVGKENSPKFIRCLDQSEEINFHFKVHTSLDIIEEKLAAPAGKNLNDQKELYLGLLFSTENHKIFGYVTNTRVKLIVVVESTNTSLRDNEVRTMFRKLHLAYTDTICNPFYVPGDMISSKYVVELLHNEVNLKFETVVDSIMNGQ